MLFEPGRPMKDIIKRIKLVMHSVRVQRHLRTGTPGDILNAGEATSSPSNKRMLGPTAATSSQDPSTGRLGKRARVDSAPFDTPGESHAAQVSAPLATDKTSSAGTLPAATKRSRSGTPPAATKRFKAGTLPADTKSPRADTPPATDKCAMVIASPVATSSSNHKSQVTKPQHIIRKLVAVDTKRKRAPSSEDGRAPKRIRDCACHECIDHGNHVPSNGSRNSKFPVALLPFKERSRRMKRDCWARRKWKAKPSPLSQDGDNSVISLRGVQSAHLARYRNRNTSHIAFNEDDPDSASPAGLADSGANTPSLAPNALGTSAPVPMPLLHIGTPLINTRDGVLNSWLVASQDASNAATLLAAPGPFGVDTFVPMPLASPSLGAVNNQHLFSQDASNTAALLGVSGTFGLDMPAPAALTTSNYGVFDSWLVASQDTSNTAALQAVPGTFGVDTFVPMPFAAPSNGAISGQYPAGQDASNTAALQAAPATFGLDIPAPAALAASNYGVYDSWSPASQDTSNAAALQAAPGPF
ncbi:hypothetical protein H4S07_003287, partial [Coemansia furcata]